MKTATKWAIALLVIHTLADIGFLVWMGIETDGEIELGIFAAAAHTVDVWFAALYWPLGHILDSLAYWIKDFWPFRNELAGYIILVFIPLGGAIYAAFGWLLGHALEWIRKHKAEQGVAPLRRTRCAEGER